MVKTENIDFINIKQEVEDAADTFTESEVFAEHIEVFTCDKCEDQFKDKAALRKHINTHISNNKKNLSIFCEICDKGYVFYSNFHENLLGEWN